MVYKLKENIFDDTECTVQDVSKEMPVAIPYDQITRVMMIQDFKSDQVFLQLKVKGAGSIMIPIEQEDMELAKNICAFVQARIEGETYTPPVAPAVHQAPAAPIRQETVVIEEEEPEKKPLFRHKFSWCLLISFLIGMAYLVYSAVYWTNAAGSDLGGSIATALVYPHLICLFIAVILNFLAVVLRNTWLAMTAAIMYTIAIFLFPMYFMFVIVEAVLCWIAFGFYVSKKR